MLKLIVPEVFWKGSNVIRQREIKSVDVKSFFDYKLFGIFIYVYWPFPFPF